MHWESPRWRKVSERLRVWVFESARVMGQVPQEQAQEGALEGLREKLPD